MSSEGLILVTNDGELANRLTHPRYGVEKTYRVLVAGRPDRRVLTKLRQGVHLAEGVARAERVEVKSHHKESTILEIVLREGQNREIRRMLAAWATRSMRLMRIAVGPVRLGDLGPGESRRLTHEELKALAKPPESANRNDAGRGARRNDRAASAPPATPTVPRHGVGPARKRAVGPGHLSHRAWMSRKSRGASCRASSSCCGWPAANDPLLGRPLAVYDVIRDAAGEPRWIDIVYLTSAR